MKSFDREKVNQLLAAGRGGALYRELRALLQRHADLQDRLDTLRAQPMGDALECWTAREALIYAVPEELHTAAAVRRVMGLTEEAIGRLLAERERALARENARQVPGQLRLEESGGQAA